MERPNFSWDLSRVDEKIQPCPEAVTDPHHVEMVREVCEAFRKNVKPKLHLLPKQIIHGDPNYTNLVFSSRYKHCSQYSVQDIAFIDFGHSNLCCLILSSGGGLGTSEPLSWLLWPQLLRFAAHSRADDDFFFHFSFFSFASKNLYILGRGITLGSLTNKLYTKGKKKTKTKKKKKNIAT